MPTSEDVPSSTEITCWTPSPYRPFQCVAIDLVEYKAPSLDYKYVLSVIDHLTRFVLLVAIRDKKASMVARTIVERVVSVFSRRKRYIPIKAQSLKTSLSKSYKPYSVLRKLARRRAALKEIQS